MMTSTLAPTTGLRLVVADDEPTLLKALCDLLEDAGHSVVGTAADGREAVEAVRANRPDLLMTDLRMPTLTGIEVARRLRVEAPDLPVIILSAYDDASLQMDAEGVPVAAYLVKGCSSRAIFRAIDRAVAS